MPRKLFHLGLLGVVMVAGVVSYAVRRNLTPAHGQSMDCARRWLTLSNTQCRNIRNEDPDFQQDAQDLSQSLEEARQTMVAMIADPETSSQTIQSQALAVLEAHHTLMRRTVGHFLVMRRLTDTSQCTRLNELCSSVMRPSEGRGMGRVRQGRGQGSGMGMQRRWRRGQNALAPALALTDTQLQAVAQIDPDYEADVSILTEQAKATHLALAEILQDVNSSNETVQQALEQFIEAQHALEKRTVDHVLNIRPLLNPEQQQRLIGLSQGQGRRRWGRGR